VNQSSPNLAEVYGSDRSVPRRFPIDNILLQSGDIRDQVAKILMFMGRQIFWERDPKFLTQFY